MEQKTARITVLGGTGYAGSAIVKEASRRGHEVTSVSRSTPTKPLGGVSYIAGSVLDQEVITQAVAERDVVFETLSPRGDMAGKVEGIVDTLISLTAGTRTRLGVLGGASSLLEKLKASPADLDWFYVSPPAEFGAWAPAEETGTYRLSDDVLLRDDTGRSNISAADLARAVLDEMEQPKHRRQRFHAAH
ncbi:NAD(P)H-binding protein [Paeniglutamicibacter antarcticus]|uniref:NAD(P)H-binding protein n=1 Tax=Arthrobacter terrae TaxID=2935737 RepID=A0A931CL74_9MICC|nr:NAD(P)H-binding protein [Arthrobacter terrae]MBG0737901.1 NAD(P)H-binding protein [Arthrobacter terrae]